MMHGQANII